MQTDDYFIKGEFYAGEEPTRRGDLIIIGCDSATNLARNVHAIYSDLYFKASGEKRALAPDSLLTNITQQFEDDGMDGTCSRLPRTVEDADVFIFQNCMDKREGRLSVHRNLLELYELVCNVSDHGAANIAVVSPYYPWGRQHKASEGERECAFAHDISLMMKEKGVNRFLCYHPHDTGVVRPFRYISGADLFIHKFLQFKGDSNTVVVSIDGGGKNINEKIAKHLELDFVPGLKSRYDQTVVESKGIMGDLEDKTRLITIDDESATFSSIQGLLEKIAHVSEIKEIYLGLSHLRVSKKYLGRIEEARKYGLVKLFTTDSVPQREEVVSSDLIDITPLAMMWAYVVNRIHNGKSVRELFNVGSKIR
jgi:ribose-phosphate pyrophosphokinase